MRKNTFSLIFKMTLLGFISFLPKQVAASLEPRTFIWGLIGREDVARLDALLPIKSNYLSLLYLDLQAKAATDNAWNTGFGIGYRAIAFNQLWGGYLFFDRNESNQGKNFYFLNPGVEFIHAQGWELRANGYIPASKRLKQDGFSSTFSDTCGNNFQCDQMFFKGHQQFFQPISSFQEVGPGADVEIGKHFSQFNHLAIYGGGYFYSLQEQGNIKGVEARAVLPINSNLAFTAETTYDNHQKGVFLAGLRVLIGNKPRYQSFSNHLYDPIIRNLGASKTGASVPIISGKKFEQPILVRDNIYFFTNNDGVSFAGASTGTFENPLASNQFVQTTVDGISAIAPNANLYFRPGSYIINSGSPSAPNASIQLHAGQSLHGRTNDYKCSATFENLPELLGEIDLAEDHNWLDSISILNSAIVAVGGRELTALSIQNAQDVFICNSIITAQIRDLNNNQDEEFTTGINANNSSVRITDSIINSIVLVDRNNIGAMLGRVLVVGIGANNDNFVGNSFVITNSQINSFSNVQMNNFGFIFVTGIGANARGTSPINFTNNIFDINSTLISVNAQTMLAGTNFAAGIGANGQQGNVLFGFNLFNIEDTQISSTAFATNSNNGSSNFATVIGGNDRNLSTLTFTQNSFLVTNSELNSSANIELNNDTGNNASAGIGSNAHLGSALSDFVNNFISLSGTHIRSSAIIGGDNRSAALPNPFGSNFATGIGGNTSRAATSADFNNNTIIIQNSAFDVLAEVGNNSTSTSLNQATGIGCNPFINALTTAVFINNRVNATSTTFNVTAHVLGINLGRNLATGFKADTGTIMNIVTSQGSILALASGLTDAELKIENGGGTVNIIDSFFTVIP